MTERERVWVPVEVEVSTRQERERRDLADPKQIAKGSEIDWRSYDRRSIPGRWKAR